MRPYYEGRVIHQSHSDHGVIDVVDVGDNRSMHFGTFPRQSTMSLRKPYTLELSYTEAMMACLLLNPNPERILLVGLGGGSIVKFLLHHFTDCHIDVIEYRQDVIDIAHTYFNVPTNDPRLHIHLSDGYAFVQQHYYRADPSYDIVLIDAYDHIGMAESVGIQDFFDACAGILTSQGVMSINLWGSDKPLFNQTMARINQSFEDRSMVLPVKDKGNIIGLATAWKVGHAEMKKLKKTAEHLEIKLAINLPKSLHNLIRRNRSLITRLFV